jgi:hypothetical protein
MVRANGCHALGNTFGHVGDRQLAGIFAGIVVPKVEGFVHHDIIEIDAGGLDCSRIEVNSLMAHDAFDTLAAGFGRHHRHRSGDINMVLFQIAVIFRGFRRFAGDVWSAKLEHVDVR